MILTDELIKKIVDNLASVDTHYLFAIGPQGTVAEQIIRKTLKGKKILIGGFFDLMHYAHVLTLQKAKAMGDYLVVFVASDELARKMKGNSRPIIPLDERMEIVRELRCVDEVVTLPGDHYELSELLDKVKPDAVLLNSSEYPDLSKEEQCCRERGVELVKIERIVPESGLDTTKIIDKIIRAHLDSLNDPYPVGGY